MSEISLDTGL